MQRNRYPIKLDTKRIISNDYISIVNDDRHTHIFDFEMKQDGELFDLSDLEIEIIFAKNNGGVIIQGLNNGVTITDPLNGKLSLILDIASMDIPGRVLSEIRFKTDTQLLTVRAMDFNIVSPINKI